MEREVIKKGRITAETNYSYVIYRVEDVFVSERFCFDDLFDAAAYIHPNAAIEGEEQWLEERWNDEMGIATGGYDPRDLI